ncbi:hypothetical protein RFI_01037 [Reticulomyxa filosa]|uniref:Uncharacterized protein n=1 Tax=Reticulomyxa filosa TaxID=46433 RepID=X6PBZ0_RETFI|nr:hypothetical protein RFI_01037 [Reticulomyxa filosa]|eukprot:ETO36025.1 hypothetical protein RFI_01037 [Reticulomyxa filosa]
MLNRIPIHFHFGSFAILFMLVYLSWAYLYYSFSEHFDYFFVDPSKPINALWYFILFVYILIVWTVIFFLAKFRDTKLIPKYARASENFISSNKDFSTSFFDAQDIPEL